MSTALTLATNEKVGITLPTLISGAGQGAAMSFVEFFKVNIRNPNTRGPYSRAAGAFLPWCESQGTRELQCIQPVHVAAYIEQLRGKR